MEHVEHFQYLVSLISENGQVDAEIDRRRAGASKAFGTLNRAVFRDRNLSMNTKRQVYQACVLSVLLYGSEYWTPLKRHLKRLNSFHHRCVRMALGISHRRQWEERITATNLRERWGDEETVISKVMRRWLEWLGHLVRMPDERTPKTALFAWLPKTRPRCGPKRRWRDVVKGDLTPLEVGVGSWFEVVQSRKMWYELYSKGVSEYQYQQEQETGSVECSVCGRSFRRGADKARHKCTRERMLPVSQQSGSVQYPHCNRWFRSKGLAVHRCSTRNRTPLLPADDDTPGGSGTKQRTNDDHAVQCKECGRCFRRPGNMKRHKCKSERMRSIEDQRGAVWCSHCNRWFRTKGGLTVHKCRQPLPRAPEK